MSDPSFLAPPADSPEVQALYDEDVAGDGYVMNLTRVWAHLPGAQGRLADQIGQAATDAGLTFRERGVLVLACASTLGDAYCSFAWGGKVTVDAGPEVAASVLTGTDDVLTPRERALAAWARQLVRDPNATTPDSVQALRDAGFDDAQVVAVTLFVALRLAFSTVNDALGARPDHQLVDALPPEVRAVVTFGRPPL